jgi:SRSO17 transposase
VPPGQEAYTDALRAYVVEHLADDDEVLVIDETGCLRQGKASYGMARHYTSSAGKITDFQIGMFAACVSRHGHALLIVPYIFRNIGPQIQRA